MLFKRYMAVGRVRQVYWVDRYVPARTYASKHVGRQACKEKGKKIKRWLMWHSSELAAVVLEKGGLGRPVMPPLGNCCGTPTTITTTTTTTRMTGASCWWSCPGHEAHISFCGGNWK